MRTEIESLRTAILRKKPSDGQDGRGSIGMDAAPDDLEAEDNSEEAEGHPQFPTN